MLTQNLTQENELLLKKLMSEKELTAELEAILESIHDEIYITDAEGITLRVNNACRRLYGVEPQELIGKNVSYLADIGVFSPPLTPNVVRVKKPLSVLQITHNGKEVIATASPIFDNNGNVSRVVSITKDIREINQLKSELIDKETLMQQQNNQSVNISPLIVRDKPAQIVYRSKAMHKIVELSEKVAFYDSNVLITGDSGVGKGIISKHIHDASPRSNGPFITVNCGAIPENLIESELFGYAKGAFTGANREGKTGLFEAANKGTLFLDEISELPLSMQVKLLAAIQEKSITKVGSNRQVKLNIRLIAAANRPLEDLVSRRLFRKDLYYRLNVIPISIPPLRERKEDIVQLIYHFLDYFGRLFNKKLYISSSALDLLTEYSWPGNVRELENLVERLAIIVDDIEIKKEHIPDYMKSIKLEIINYGIPTSLKDRITAIERDIIMQAYMELKSTYKVAELLNISQSSVVRKMKIQG